MNDPFNSGGSFGNQQPVLVPPQGGPTPPSSGAMGFQFSAEELAVLRECDIESLIRRSIPLGTFLGVATWACIQKGVLAPSPKFGGTPKILAACVAGYFLGKLSYQSECADKIMKLPNSRLAEALRRRKKGEFFENFTQDGGLSLAPFKSTTEVYTDEGLKSHQNSSLDLDVERPVNFGLDDTFRPSLDTPDRSFNDNLPLEPPKSSTSYEELRRKNREEYDRRMSAPFNRSITRDEIPITRQPQAPRDDFPQQGGGVKNKYGDEWR